MVLVCGGCCSQTVLHNSPGYQDLSAGWDWLCVHRLKLFTTPVRSCCVGQGERWFMTLCQCTPFPRCDCQKLCQTSVLRHLWGATTSLLRAGAEEKEPCWCEECQGGSFSPLTLSEICYWGFWAKTGYCQSWSEEQHKPSSSYLTDGLFPPPSHLYNSKLLH